MPYLIHNNRYFTLVDSTPKNGIFCQIFSSSYTPKLIPFHPQHTSHYSACMDSTGKLYVANMPDAFHLNYAIYENNHLSRHSLVSNEQSNYQLASPVIFTLQDHPYIVYLSHQLNTNSYNFVQENLASPNLNNLLSCPTEPKLIKSYTTDKDVFIFFVLQQEHYKLCCLHITSYQVTSAVYLTISQPITDYSICLDEDLIHVTYVAEFHGKYQLSYFNSNSKQITVLSTTQSPSSPVVFCYYDLIWINAIINGKLHMLISVDNGLSFSLPVPCSLQNHIYRCRFISQKTSTFCAQEVYASLTSVPKICTLAMIDFARFHNDTSISPEAELLLEGLLLCQIPPTSAYENTSQTSQISASKTTTTISENHSTNTGSTATCNTSSFKDISKSNLVNPDSKSPSPSLEEAKSAFMNELTGWEVSPRV